MMRQKMTRFGAGVLRKLILLLCLAGILTGGLTYAKGNRTVKVAFFPMDGYHMIGQNGSFGGMDVDYLDVLRQYANWNIEYVVCESWDDALAKLEDHEVDLVGSAQYSAKGLSDSQKADIADIGYGVSVIGVERMNAESKGYTKAVENLVNGHWGASLMSNLIFDDKLYDI